MTDIVIFIVYDGSAQSENYMLKSQGEILNWKIGNCLKDIVRTAEKR